MTTPAERIAPPTPLERFLATLDIVHREGVHLRWSLQRMFGAGEPDADWVRALESRPEDAERLEAFVSRFGRMQDTIGDKLLPRWLAALSERPASMIENLRRAERLGVLDSAEEWVAARNLRNRLVHEYQTDAETFAQDLQLAQEAARLLLHTYDRLREDAHRRLGVPRDRLPPTLNIKI
ncbi:hypothetical protein Talka_01780 [Tepidimonas alkaliphilus]|uniref:Nucleotidyltransferase substrate binding protein n=1 Tax=Tepidimonas alkaliphilus TaxID=2588942 RepID=A0A554W624_9BURK|nr:hypothetical protein [Tepidimonas alkaliphilus]TSE19016.1 hypothetical protein Talka_01780 [Tepidimonas alkaliphilus]